jgi:hypothetical protein
METMANEVVHLEIGFAVKSLYIELFIAFPLLYSKGLPERILVFGLPPCLFGWRI